VVPRIGLRAVPRGLRPALREPLVALGLLAGCKDGDGLADDVECGRIVGGRDDERLGRHHALGRRWYPAGSNGVSFSRHSLDSRMRAFRSTFMKRAIVESEVGSERVAR